MKDQYFKIGSVLGECYDVTGPDRERYRNVALARDIDGGFTRMDATGKPLPDFLNAEDDDMGFLVNMDTGERMTWGGDPV